jgi:hypothetical protein
MGWKQVSGINPEGDIRDHCLFFEEFLSWKSVIQSILTELRAPCTNQNFSNFGQFGYRFVKAFWVEIRLSEVTITAEKSTSLCRKPPR